MSDFSISETKIYFIVWGIILVGGIGGNLLIDMYNNNRVVSNFKWSPANPVDKNLRPVEESYLVIPDNYTKPVNQSYQYTYYTNNVETNDTVSMLILINSARFNFYRRQIARGRIFESLKSVTNAKYLSILGEAKSTEPLYVSTAISSEMRLERDIIIANFIDTYANLTMKTLGALSFYIDYYPDVEILLTIDDDVTLSFDEHKINDLTSLYDKNAIICIHKLLKRQKVKRTGK